MRGVCVVIVYISLASPVAAQDAFRDWGPVTALEPGRTVVVKPFRRAGDRT